MFKEQNSTNSSVNRWQNSHQQWDRLICHVRGGACHASYIMHARTYQNHLVSRQDCMACTYLCQQGRVVCLQV